VGTEGAGTLADGFMVGKCGCVNQCPARSTGTDFCKPARPGIVIPGLSSMRMSLSVY